MPGDSDPENRNPDAEQPTAQQEWLRRLSSTLLLERQYAPLARETDRRMRRLTVEISKLLDRISEQEAKLRGESIASEEKVRKIEELQATVEDLKQKERLQVLLSRVNKQAQAALLNDEAFRRRFLDQAECTAFVMSVDIRRSTELMLKARTPEQFATFITNFAQTSYES